MTENIHIRWGWLKGMYIYNIVATTGAGLLFLAFPRLLESLFKFPAHQSAVRAIYGSVLLAFALVCLLGLRAPLKVAPVLLMQAAYKVIWIAVAALPLFLKGQFPFYVVGMVCIYATYIIGDLIAVPFGYLFRKD
jgi:hypothetical protein